jgi:hypothetical protein
MTSESNRPTDSIDWELTTWDGVRRVQMRQWAALPLERMIAALEEMQQSAEELDAQRSKK